MSHDAVASTSAPDFSDELTGLTQQEEQPAPQTRSRHRRVIAGVALAIGVAGLAASQRSSAPCANASLDDVMQEYAKDPVHVGIGSSARSTGAIIEWLAKANAAGEGLAKGAKPRLGKPELTRQAEDAIEQALKSNDPALAKTLVQNAMNKAVIRNKQKRNDLLAYLKQASGDKGSKGSFLTGAAPTEKPTPGPLAKAVGKAAKALTPTTKSPSAMEAEAYCTFDVLQIATTLAGFAASINDVVKTCDHVSVKSLMVSDATETHAKVCSVNLAQMAASMASLSTSSALAADDCAATMIPNLDALCAGAVTATLTASAAFAGAFTLINAACRSNGWYAKVPPGVTPSNVGSNRKILTGEGGGFRRLEDVAEEVLVEASPAAPPRQLLFGGGKAALATQCATEIANIAWSIAALVFDIYDAAGTDGDGECPPKNLLTGGERPKGLLYKLSVGLCNMHVSGALVSIFSIMIFAQLTAVTCTDELNLGAICGSGIVGILAGAAGISKAGTALWIACDVGQWPVLHNLVRLIRKVDQVSGNKITDLIRGMGDDSGNSTFGRRLHESLEESPRVAELKAKYDSPADVWKDLGFDLENPNALWRRIHKEQELRGEDLANFVQEDEESYAPLFGESRTCRK